jgi:outer membrane protein OmpA-like peptidoglycan-associated protein
MRLRGIAALALAALVASRGRLEAQKYKDPDGADVQAAAKSALAHSRVLNILGMTSGVQGLIKELNGKVTAREIRIALSADVLFDFDSFELRPQASDTLRKVAAILKEYGKAPVAIEGHTDGKGNDAYNQTLSQRRADSVKTWLAGSGGVEASRLTTRGFGRTKPVAPNTKPDGSDDPDGRQKNRRVEITITKS